MKHLLLLLILTCALPLLAQPPLPTVESVYQEIKGNEHVYAKLKSTYKIANPKACKIEMIMTIGGGDVIKSDWSTYRSDEGKELNYKWPDDRAYTIFTVTTPKSTEGIVYKLPLVVEYSRLENSVLMNKWSYHWWYFGNPYSMEGAEDDALLKQSLLAALSSSAPDEQPEAIQLFTSIQSIEKGDKADERQFYSNADYIYRTYVFSGESIAFEDYDQSIVTANYPQSKAHVQVEFIREKDENGKAGTWRFSGFQGGFGTFMDPGNPSSDKNFYSTLQKTGFKSVYQQEKKASKMPYYSETYQKQFSEELTAVLMDMQNGKPGAEEALKEFVAPGHDEVVTAFKSYFETFRLKCVDITPETLNRPEHDGVMARLDSDNDEMDENRVWLYVHANRKSCASNNELKKRYKDAGMSKQILATGGVYYYTSTPELKVMLVDGEIKLLTGPEFTEEIPF